MILLVQPGINFFRRLQIALALLGHEQFWSSLKKFTHTYLFQILLEVTCLPILIILKNPFHFQGKSKSHFTVHENTFTALFCPTVKVWAINWIQVTTECAKNSVSRSGIEQLTHRSLRT